jgi:Spy/CpxP family protein refolding chaperone
MKSNLTRFAAVAALAAGMSFAQQATPAPQPAPAKPMTGVRAHVRNRMMQKLNLTDAQKQQAKAIFQQARQTAQPIRQQLRQNRQSMAAAVKANATAQIQSLAATQGTLRGQAMAIRAQALAKFYTTLTPDQRAKADQLHEQFRQRVEQRRAQHTNG